MCCGDDRHTVRSPAAARDGRELQAALEGTVAALQTALEEATAAEALSKQFLADAARQLRPPVGSIHDGVRVLLHGPPDDHRDQLLADLVRNGARGARLVNSLLRLARLDAGERLAPAPCNLASVCSGSTDHVRRRAPHLDVIVVAQPPPPTAPQVDEQTLRDILAELLDNARRHAAERITVTAAASSEVVEVSVQDDGPGIPAGQWERAFERFTSLDGMGGAGLGLCIARELARRHGGDLTYAQGMFVLRLAALSG